MASTKKSTSPVQALADARALAEQREADQRSAAVAYEAMREQLAAGDDTITALDLAAAHFQIERTSLLVPSAKAAVKRAEEAVETYEAQTSPTLAQWLHQLIETNPFAFGLQGMPIKVVPTVPSDAEGPAAFLTQTKPTDVDPSTGMMSGTVWIDVIPPPSMTWDHAPVVNAVQRLIEDAGLAERASVTPRQQLTAPKLMVDIFKLQPEIPTLPLEAPERALNDFGTMVLGSVVAAGDKVKTGEGTYLYEMTRSSISGEVEARELVGLDDDSGRLRRRVSVTLGLSGRHDQATLRKRIELAVSETLAGKTAPWLGRIESGSVASLAWAEDKRIDEVGRIHRSKCTVRAEFVMVSQAIG